MELSTISDVVNIVGFVSSTIFLIFKFGVFVGKNMSRNHTKKDSSDPPK